MLSAHHSIANVSVERGAVVESARVALEVSGNGQQYMNVGTYSYHAHPVVSRLLPTNGPFAGGTALTLRGEALRGGDVYRCRFAMGFDPVIETPASFSTAADGVLCDSRPAPRSMS